MNARRGRCLRLQKAMWLLVVVATVSMVITLHLGDGIRTFRSRTETGPKKVDGFPLENKETRDYLPLREFIISDKMNYVPLGQMVHRNTDLRPHGLPSQIINGDTQKRKYHVFHNLVASEISKRINITTTKINSQFGMHSTTSTGNRALFYNEKNVFHLLNSLQPNLTHTKTMPNIRNSNITSKLTVDAGIKEYSAFQTKNNYPGNFREFKRENQNIMLPDINAKPRKSQGTDVQQDSNDLSTLGILYDKITQIEKPSSFPVSVVVTGSRSAVNNHLPLIQAAFRKYKTKVTYQHEEDETTHGAGKINWCINMCLNTTHEKDSCVIISHTSGHQKVSVIPELMPVLTSPRLLCRLSDNRLPGKGRGQWYGDKLPCYTFTLPNDTNGVNCNNTSGWWILIGGNDSVFYQYIACSKVSFYLGNHNFGENENIFVSLPKDLLKVDGTEPLVWQTEVLVTSLLPPRVYLHPAGLAWSGLQDFIARKHQKNVSLLELRQLVIELANESTSDMTITRLQSTIMEVVRFLETHIMANGNQQRLCPKCFQVLAVVVVFDSSFQPIILQVIPNPFSEHLNSLSDYLLDKNVLDDLAAMLVSRETTSKDLVRALRYLGLTHASDGRICSDDNTTCLGEVELTYLLDTRREQRAAKNWIRLFPSTAVKCGQTHSTPSSTMDTAYASGLKPVGFFEKFVVSVEEYFLCPSANLDDGEKLMFNLSSPVNSEVNNTSDLVPGKLSNTPNLQLENCHIDNSSLPLLSAISIYPYVQLFPEFSPLTTEYQAYVDYQTTIIRIRGVTKHCETQAKLEDRHARSRWSNFSLGVGENTAHILVVGTAQLESSVLNSYKITIHRRMRGQNLGRSDSVKGHHYACSLKQDCSLLLSPNASCGLQPATPGMDWERYLSYKHALPPCGTEDVPGEWMLPCADCNKEASCDWHEAHWQPSGCQERQLSTDELKSCLVDKKVLFVGDSTNRGILHYMLERLNGSLLRWNKTHSICVYPDLNDGQTLFAFSYYPQFWITSKERPAFSSTLHSLFNKTADWSGKDTVVVLGGVHWLAKQHLNILADELHREGLSKARVIVKGLGAGFHQPVTGAHHLTYDAELRLFDHNQAVMSHARQLGFLTVDTFSMTMSRYKDFLPGKCSCHFHQVSAVQPSVINKMSWKSTIAADLNPTYHVEGDINSIYSEMVINRICFGNGGREKIVE